MSAFALKASSGGSGIVCRGPGDYTICPGCLTGKPAEPEAAETTKREWLASLVELGGEG